MALIPDNSLVNLLCTLSIATTYFLVVSNQNGTQDTKCGLNYVLYRCIMMTQLLLDALAFEAYQTPSSQHYVPMSLLSGSWYPSFLYINASKVLDIFNMSYQNVINQNTLPQTCLD